MIKITGCNNIKSINVTIHQGPPQVSMLDNDTPKDENRRMGSPRELINEGVMKALAFL